MNLIKTNGKKHKSAKSQAISARILMLLLSSVLVLVAVHLVLQYLNMNVFHQQNGQIYELSNRFDLDDESSVPTWLASFLFLAISLLAALTAWLQKDNQPKRLWALMSIGSLVASIDEVAMIHEFVLQTLHVAYFKDALPTGFSNAWLVVMPFILLAFFWLCWRMWQILPHRIFVIFVVAGIVFLMGAVGVDLVTSISDRETFFSQGLLVAVEESLELLGCSLVLFGIVEYLEAHYYLQLKQAYEYLINVNN